MNITMNNSVLLMNMTQLNKNVSTICAHLGDDVALVPVLKDNAYGLGLVEIGTALSKRKAVRCIAVAHVSEGLALREAGIAQAILVMGNPLAAQLCTAVEAGLTLSIGRLGLVPVLAQEAQRQGRTLHVQIKLDTGLHRIGVEPGEELHHLIQELNQVRDSILVEGAFTHFSDVGNESFSKVQYQRYLQGVEQLEQGGISVKMRHVSGSAASEQQPQYHLNAVRIGRRLYLDHPTRPLGDIGEVATWRTWITAVKLRCKGDTLGYGGKYTLVRDTLVATIGIGYGDGLNEALVQAHGPVLVQGQRCPLLACCMDQAFVDVTGLHCVPDEAVTLFGADGEGNTLSAQEVSLLVGDNEGCGLTAALSGRVARVYVDEILKDRKPHPFFCV